MDQDSQFFVCKYELFSTKNYISFITKSHWKTKLQVNACICGKTNTKKVKQYMVKLVFKLLLNYEQNDINCYTAHF